jgi:hypothetical protein
MSVCGVGARFCGSAVTVFFFLRGFLFGSKCIPRNGVGSYKNFLTARICLGSGLSGYRGLGPAHRSAHRS